MTTPTLPDRWPIVLCILDGFGLAPPGPHNAVSVARTPNWSGWWGGPSCAKLSASGEDVGLPPGQFGNSEVGHLNLGAGRIVYQDILAVARAIRDGSFYDNPALGGLFDHLARTGGRLHLLGLVSDGGVHSHIDHLRGYLEMARRRGVDRVFLHAFLDGRDTPPRSAPRYADAVEALFAEYGRGRVATVTGRYYAMDRDQRWERTELAYQGLVRGEGYAAGSFREALEQAYARGEDDEFVKPTVIRDAAGAPLALVASGDGCANFNFRPDRARQITRALALDDCPFARPDRPRDLGYVCLTQYQTAFALPAMFPPKRVADTLGEVYARRGLRQLRLAETEKYAHVTYFFSGGVEEPLAGEDRVLIPSRQDVATYDLAPEMSADGVTEAFERELARRRHQLIVMNYANADMVGHSGGLAATVRAIEVVDECLGRVARAVQEQKGILLVTSDHGTAERTWDEENGCPHTAHTDDLVPLVILGQPGEQWGVADGILADIAPTILRLAGLPVPEAMTGRDLTAAAAPSAG